LKGGRNAPSAGALHSWMILSQIDRECLPSAKLKAEQSPLLTIDQFVSGF
jgi:hypothetical protein